MPNARNAFEPVKHVTDVVVADVVYDARLHCVRKLFRLQRMMKSPSALEFLQLFERYDLRSVFLRKRRVIGRHGSDFIALLCAQWRPA